MVFAEEKQMGIPLTGIRRRQWFLALNSEAEAISNPVGDCLVKDKHHRGVVSKHWGPNWSVALYSETGILPVYFQGFRLVKNFDYPMSVGSQLLRIIEVLSYFFQFYSIFFSIRHFVFFLKGLSYLCVLVINVAVI